ncbi:hypothetical protein V7183_21350, partial [Bacillus sp. JJ1127]
VFFHIYMKKVVLHDDNDSRESTNIHHDRYAMEMSHEYLNRSEIEKVRTIQKENDTKNKMK